LSGSRDRGSNPKSDPGRIGPPASVAEPAWVPDANAVSCQRTLSFAFENPTNTAESAAWSCRLGELMGVMPDRFRRHWLAKRSMELKASFEILRLGSGDLGSAEPRTSITALVSTRINLASGDPTPDWHHGLSGRNLVRQDSLHQKPVSLPHSLWVPVLCIPPFCRRRT